MTKIVRLRVVRTPIEGALNRLLNILSFGKMKRMKRKHNFNDYFHLYLVAGLEDGKEVVMEKNERVNVSGSFHTNSKSQYREVPLPTDRVLTARDMLKTTLSRIGNRAFWQYRAFSFNCQRFVSDILRSNGLMNPELDGFINQPTEEIAKGMSKGFKKVVNAVTDVGAWFSKAIGKGKRPKGKRKASSESAPSKDLLAVQRLAKLI